MLEPGQRHEEFIQESIDSITSKHSRIKLKELDRILRRTVPRPAAYNLQRSLQAMIQSGTIDGYLEGNTFVRTGTPKLDERKRPSKQDIKRVRETIIDLLKDGDSVNIRAIERETGVDRWILRRTLLILLGEGAIDGMLEEDTFTLDNTKHKDINE